MSTHWHVDYKDLRHRLMQEFYLNGRTVQRMEWQSLTDDRPQTQTFEIADVNIDSVVPITVGDWEVACKPNLPWAEDHFQERIGGEPLNPGEEYKNWPWYEGGVEEHKETGKFSHTYMERMWGKYANSSTPNIGVRYVYGDLANLIHLLQDRPLTRQAYLPIWFPEDLNAADEMGERVPCSLGYLIQYNPQTSLYDMWYYMRSVDFNRYLWDDLYMAGRLLQHVCANAASGGLRPGMLHTKIANLHVFEAERNKLMREYELERNERIANAF